MKTFTMGAIVGASALAVSVPLLAQVSSAASTTATAADQLKQRPIPSQECVQAMADQEGTMLSKIDAMVAAHKSAMQTHQKALAAAASIADATQRQEAIKAANDAMRTTMKATMDAQGDPAASMEALKAACGDTMPMGGMHMDFMMGGPGGKGHGMMKMKFNLAEKLGMTEADLKAQLDAGKTIQDIAKEKGVTLPARPEGARGFRGPMMDMMQPADAQ